MTAFARPVVALRPSRRAVLVTAGTGLAVGLVGWAGPHALAAALGGAGGVVAAVQAVAAVRRSVRAVGLLAGD